MLGEFVTGDDMDHLALSAESFVDESPTTIQEARERPDSDLWTRAINEEIIFKKNNTWTIVEKPNVAVPIQNKWVFAIKRDETGKTVKYKARLFAKGFMQREGYDFTEIYAPVVGRLITVKTKNFISSC